MKKDKVSIIIAVYKAEKYFPKCMESVLNQTYDNLEIILVDDGSPDNCPKMCDDYVAQDKRVKVIHQKNGGVSAAWNTGLNNVTGDYVAFVDSDDWVEHDYIKVMYDAIKEFDCDIAICGNKIIKGGIVSEDRKSPQTKKFYPANEVKNVFFGQKCCRHTTWGKLYKKEIFEVIRYPEHILCAEDTYMICDICAAVKKGIVTLPDMLYNYVIQNQSVTTTITIKRLDWIRAKEHILEVLEPDDSIYRYAVQNLFFSYIDTYKSFKKHKLKYEIKQLNLMFKKDYKKYVKYLKGRDRIKNFIFRYFRWFFNLLSSIKNKK